MKAKRYIVLPAAAVSFTLLILWYAHRPATVVQSNMEQVRQEAERGGYRLIDVEHLSKQYRSNKEKLLLVDTRQQWEHRAGYIDGSVSFPMEPNWWARWQGKKDLLALLGPDKNKSIVFY